MIPDSLTCSARDEGPEDCATRAQAGCVNVVTVIGESLKRDVFAA